MAISIQEHVTVGDEVKVGKIEDDGLSVGSDDNDGTNDDEGLKVAADNDGAVVGNIDKEGT